MRYYQSIIGISIRDGYVKNDFQLVVSPNKEEHSVWIHQDAWFNLADFDQGITKEYTFQKEGYGAYIFVLEGKIKIGEQEVGRRDAIGIWDTKSFEIETMEDAKFIVLDVPMELPEYLK